VQSVSTYVDDPAARRIPELYTATIIMVVLLFYVSSAKAMLMGATAGRAEADHLDLFNYYRERADFNHADQHLRAVSGDSKQKPVASMSFYMARGQYDHAAEAAGKAITIFHGKDTPENRSLLLSYFAGNAIPDGASSEERARLSRTLIEYLVKQGAPPIRVMLAVRNCLAFGHIDPDDFEAIRPIVAQTDGTAEYLSNIELLFAANDPLSVNELETVNLARDYIANDSHDLLVRAFYFQVILNIWLVANEFPAIDDEMLLHQDRFPEAHAHLVDVADQVRDLGAEIKTGLAADLFATMAFPLKMLHGSAVGAFVDDELGGRPDDWQRQVSDEVMDFSGVDVTRLARAASR